MVSARDYEATLVSDDRATARWTSVVAGLEVVSATAFSKLVAGMELVTD
jgi:hypothetical protein